MLCFYQVEDDSNAVKGEWGVGVALLQGFWLFVLYLVILIHLVSCPWKREQVGDAGSKTGYR